MEIHFTKTNSVQVSVCKERNKTDRLNSLHFYSHFVFKLILNALQLPSVIIKVLSAICSSHKKHTAPHAFIDGVIWNWSSPVNIWLGRTGSIICQCGWCPSERQSERESHRKCLHFESARNHFNQYQIFKNAWPKKSNLDVSTCDHLFYSYGKLRMWEKKERGWVA